MKATPLQKWCDQAWLYVVYLLGIVMGNILLIQWPDWSVPQILMCLLAIAIPLHIFEENTVPGGFFFMNNLGRKSDAPLGISGKVKSEKYAFTSVGYFDKYENALDDAR